MALATTCPQCKTSFKVVPDQLKLRRGLVRCGVCQHVFSGIDYLRYVDDSGKTRQKTAAPGSAASQEAVPLPSLRQDHGDRAAPQAAASESRKTMAAQPGGAVAGSSASPQTVFAADDDLKTAFFLSDSSFGPYSQTRPQDVVPPQSIVARDGTPIGGGASLAAAASTYASGQLLVSDSTDDHEADPRRAASTRLALPIGTSTSRRGADGESRPDTSSRRQRSPTSLLAPGDEVESDVMAANPLARQARESHRTGSGRRRASRSHASPSFGDGDGHSAPDGFAAFIADPWRCYTVIGLVLLAALQLTLLFRNEIASRVAPLRPVLAVMASAVGLSVDAVRSLSSLSIESFELQSTGRDDYLTLNAVLRNKSGQLVRWPAMQLTLTDQAQSVVVRKVILPEEFLNRNAPRDGLEGRSEWPVRISLDPGGLQLAGYSVELFYP